MYKRRIKSMGMTTKTLTKLSEVQAIDDRGQTSWTMRTKKTTTTSRSIRRSPRRNTHCLLLKRTQNPTTSWERSPAAKKAKPQCAEREQPQAPTSGPALAWVPTKRGLRRLIEHPRLRKEQPLVVAKERQEQLGEQHEHEQGVHVANADSPQAATFISIRTKWTLKYTICKWFPKLVVLQDTLIRSQAFTSNTPSNLRHHSKYFVHTTISLLGRRHSILFSCTDHMFLNTC